MKKLATKITKLSHKLFTKAIEIQHIILSHKL